MSALDDRPVPGEPTLLVHRECGCGFWCATGEGARHPICPRCGQPMEPLYDRLGYVAVLMPEHEAVTEVRKRSEAT